jgi:SAM-dependent methyltransferase
MNNFDQQKILELVKRNYEEIAEDFDATRKKAPWPELQKIIGGLPPGAKILDAGCGNGRLAGLLPESGVNYLGFDQSEVLLEKARRNNPGFKFVSGNLLTLSQFPDRDFSHIFCIAVLQHLPSADLRQETIKQLATKLAPGGQLIISAWNLWSQPWSRRLLFRARWLKILGRNKLDYDDLIFPWKNARGQIISQRYYHAFTDREWRRLADVSGLKTMTRYKDRHNYWLILQKP